MRVRVRQAWRTPASVLAILALVLTACGGGDDTPDDAAAPAPEQEEEEEAPDPEDEESEEPEVDDLADLEPVHLRLSTIVGPGGSISGIMEWFNEELEARTDGKVTAEIAYAGSLLPGPDFLAGMVEGRAEGGLLVPAYHPTELALMNLIMVPVQGHSQGARPRAMQHLMDNNEAVQAELEAAGAHVIGMTPNSTQVAVLTARVESVADYDGLIMRIPGIPGIGFSEIGVEPAFLSAEEVYESLQRGIVDGVTFPWDTHWNTGTYEVGDYIVQDGIGESGMATYAISKSLWDSLDPRVQQIMNEIAEGWYDKLEDLLSTVDMEACDAYIENGNEIIIFSDEEKEKMREATSDVMFDKWRDDAIATGLDAVVVDEVWETYDAKVLEFNATTAYVDAPVACLERMG